MTGQSGALTKTVNAGEGVGLGKKIKKLVWDGPSLRYQWAELCNSVCGWSFPGQDLSDGGGSAKRM